MRILAWVGFIGTILLSAHSIFTYALDLDVAGFLLDARAFEMGRTLFDSFFEINTPSNVWLPVVALKLSHILPWMLADVFQAGLFLFIVACAAATVWLIRQRLEPGQPVTMLVASVLVPALVVWFPYLHFGQREQLFLASLGPFAVIVGGRYLGVVPSRGLALGAAALVAFGASLKPHFMLVVALFVWADFCFHRGRLREIGLEVYASSALLIAYVALIAIAYPLYLSEMLPTAAATYFTMRTEFAIVAGRLGIRRITETIGAALLLMAFLAYRRSPSRFLQSLVIPILWFVLTAASVAVYLAQSQGFHYHRIVLIALLTMGSGVALAVLVDEFRETIFRRLSWLPNSGAVVVMAMLCLGSTGLLFYAIKEYEPAPTTRQAALGDLMTRFLQGLPPGTPILMLEPGIGPISPLHAYADIRWTGEFSTLLVLRPIYNERDKAAAEQRPIAPRMAQVERDVRRYVLESFFGTPPEIVFVDISGMGQLSWFYDYPKPVSLIDFFLEQPAFAAEWKKYEKIGEMRSLNTFDVAVYRRRKDGQ